jgi:hypothetical protein
MRTNDIAVWIGIAVALLMAFTALALAKFGNSATAANWTQSVLTGFAVVVALSMPIYERQRKHAHDERVATMRVTKRLDLVERKG